MAEIIIPNQFFGIGDIIWCQSLVRKIANGAEVIWPCEPQFVDGLNRAYPHIKFVDRTAFDLDYERKDEYERDGMRVLPLRWADSIMKVPYSDCMKSKYMMYGLDWQNWRVHAMWKRDGQKEYDLRIALQLPPKYNLINRTFGSNSQLDVPIHVDNGLPNIDMRTIEGFSLFDWAYVLENAAEIHTVSTSIIYLLEMLELKAECVHLHPRKPIEHDFRNVEYILERHEYVKHG